MNCWVNLTDITSSKSCSSSGWFFEWWLIGGSQSWSVVGLMVNQSSYHGADWSHHESWSLAWSTSCWLVDHHGHELYLLTYSGHGCGRWSRWSRSWLIIGGTTRTNDCSHVRFVKNRVAIMGDHERLATDNGGSKQLQSGPPAVICWVITPYKW